MVAQVTCPSAALSCPHGTDGVCLVLEGGWDLPVVLGSLYVGGPLLLGLLSFKNNGREQLSDKNLMLHFLLAKM